MKNVVEMTVTQLRRLRKDDLIDMIMQLQTILNSEKNINNEKNYEVVEDFHYDRIHSKKSQGIKIIKIKGQIVKIVYKFENGAPLGFDYTRCASIFNKETGKWNNIADYTAINFNSQGVDYISNDEKKEATSKRFIEEMEKYMIKLLS